MKKRVRSTTFVNWRVIANGYDWLVSFTNLLKVENPSESISIYPLNLFLSYGEFDGTYISCISISIQENMRFRFILPLITFRDYLLQT